MRLRNMLMLVSLITVSLILFGMVWLLTTSKSVIWSFSESGQVSPMPTFAIFNPFRETKSESEAERGLRSIREGLCHDLTFNLGHKERYDSLCENLRNDNLKDWKLAFREDHNNTVTLFYRTSTASDSSFNSAIMLKLEKQAEQWHLIDIGSVY